MRNARQRAAYNKHAREHNLIRMRADRRLPMLAAAKRRAKKYAVPINIKLNDIVIPATCPALGITIVGGFGTVSAGSPTLDRIIPELGYVHGNIVVISHMANSMKRGASPEQLRAVATWLEQAYPAWLLA